MNRSELVSRLRTTALWDFLVIGGGATGLGVALEAASRGYLTLLLEQSDFCKGTSSKSTKLIHGGIRYLEQGNVTLVIEALRERERLLRNAPHIVTPQSFIIPTYSRWETGYYTAGLKLYDLLAGKQRIRSSRLLSAKQVLQETPVLDEVGLRGGVLFFDAQFDDARLSIALAKTCAIQGGTLLNYAQVTKLIKARQRVCGVLAEDVITGTQFEIRAKVVANCTGAFSDQLRSLDSDANPMISLSRGSHVVLAGSVLGGSKSGILVPRTSDNRVLFAIPWYGRVLAGTTEVPVESPELEPKPAEEEIEFILSNLGRYLSSRPGKEEILSVFAGLRPLIGSMKAKSTASLSRDHRVLFSETGLVSVVGGKWTTYRKMGEDAVSRAAAAADLPSRDSITKNLRLCETRRQDPEVPTSSVFSPAHGERLLASLSFLEEDVVHAVRQEWACTVEDVLARRSRLLLLDARASMEIAPKVASLIAAELGYDESWQEKQVAHFRELARGYLPAAH